MSIEIKIIPVLNDNYIFLLKDIEGEGVAVIDPSVSGEVLKVLEDNKWKLTHILNTHHHFDHVGGNLELKALTGAKVVGPKLESESIPGIDIEVGDKDIFFLGKTRLEVLQLSGHTRGHIGFYSKEHDILFSGDVLFGLGCGRVFEGTHADMYQALGKIKDLPKSTQIYCAHEYAERNIDFAISMDSKSQTLLDRVQRIRAQRIKQLPTVPLVLGEELETNPFLRAGDLSSFSYLRSNRDKF
jgi:hydroxyacylglutathione hydrolase